jgi:hypothetical protein
MTVMDSVAGFSSESEAVEACMSGMRFLAGSDATMLPAGIAGDLLKQLEKLDAVEAVARAGLLWKLDAERGYEAEGYRAVRGWLRHRTRVTKGEVGAHLEVLHLCRQHPLFAGAMVDGHLTRSVAARIGKLTGKIEEDLIRADLDQMIVTAAAAGVEEKDLVVIAEAYLERLAPPDPDKPFRDRYLRLETTFEGAGVLRGDLTPECAAMLQAVLVRLARRQGKEDTRQQGERNHDALQEMLRRLLGSDLVPKVNGHPVQAQVHLWLADLIDLDDGSVLQQQWTARYAARWAAARVHAAEGLGDGGAWIYGAAAKGIVCDAALFPIVSGDPDLDAVDDLIRIAVEIDRYLHTGDRDRDTDSADSTDSPGCADQAAQADASPRDAGPERSATFTGLLRDLIGAAAAMMSGEPGLASFLRRGLLGPLGLGGPSLPLDVGDTDAIPWWIRQAVHARDGYCQFPTGCDEPATGCHPHHIKPRAEHGPTKLDNLGDFCPFHHLIVIHGWGWKVRKLGDGTWEATAPDGTVYTSGRPPPPRPG